jgi:hypothetical protein
VKTRPRRLAVLVTLSSFALSCNDDSLSLVALAGPPNETDPEELPLGAAMEIHASVSHSEIEGSTTVHATDFRVDDPSIVRIAFSGSNVVLAGAREGTTTLRFRARSDYTVTIRVARRPP